MKGNAYVPFMLRRGDGSTLSLDFAATGSLDSRFTFTRSTTATFINSSGYVESIGAAASNDPTKARFDYNPTTLTANGLLIEGSATNIATYSNDFSNAIWALDNSGGTIPAVSTVSQTGPDGASTVTRITFNKTGGVFSRIRQTLSGTASQPYTMSVWMKANTASGGASTQNVGLRIGADSAGFNCIVTTTWKRFQYTYTLSGTDAAAQIMLWDNITNNDETADVLVYGCQIELGSGASSYIPTGASQGARAADSCAILLSSFGFSTTAGTLYADWFRKNGDSGSQSGGPWSTDYATPRWLAVQNAIASNTVSLASWSGSTNIANGSTRNKAAATYGAWTGSVSPTTFCVNNSAVTSANRDFNPSTATYLTIGAASSSGGSTPAYGVATRDWLNNSIRVIKYWPSILPDATIQSLTA